MNLSPIRFISVIQNLTNAITNHTRRKHKLLANSATWSIFNYDTLEIGMGELYSDSVPVTQIL